MRFLHLLFITTMLPTCNIHSENPAILIIISRDLKTKKQKHKNGNPKIKSLVVQRFFCKALSLTFDCESAKKPYPTRRKEEIEKSDVNIHLISEMKTSNKHKKGAERMNEIKYTNPTYQTYLEDGKYAYQRGIKLHTDDGDEIGEACGSYLSFGQPDRVVITKLYIKPEYRRQGYGRQLVSYLDQIAREVGANWIQNNTFDRCVFEHHLAAQVFDEDYICKIYEKLGFYVLAKKPYGYLMRRDVRW